MSPEQRFARWVKVALAAFVVLFVYFLIADSFMPLTPEARVLRPVTRIAPELSAPVSDVVFRLDAEPFQLALDEATLQREQAELDAWPGRVLEGHVSAFDAGVREGQLAADGQLADIPTTDRWVRDAQRLRLHVSLDEPLDALPASGARASVQLVPGDHLLASPLALSRTWFTARFTGFLR